MKYFQWLETRPNRSSCPVCKAGISRDKVIPLYGRGSTNQSDPRDKTPPRPQGQRSEPENNGVSRRHEHVETHIYPAYQLPCFSQVVID